MDLRRLWIVTLPLWLLLAGCGEKPKPAEPGKLPGDQALFDDGMKSLEKKDWDKARTLLQQLVDSYPQSSLTPKARIAIADSHFKQDDEVHRAQAQVEYQAFISLYPFSEQAAYSQYQIGLLKFNHLRISSRDQADTLEALKAFQKVVSDYPGSEFAPQAKEKVAACKDRLADHELVVGIFYYKRKSYDSAVARLRQLQKDYPDFSGMDSVYFYMAESLMKLGKKDEALPYYQRLSDGKPGPFKQKAADRLREAGAEAKTPTGTA